MLTRSVTSTSAQPASRSAHTRRRLSAAGGVFAAIIAILLPLAPSEDAAAAASGSGAWPWPLLGEVITPYKNGGDPYAAGQHRGLDIAAPAGSPVLAIVDGRVSFSGRLPDGGETVTVASGDGAWLVSDLHLSGRSVSRGDAVHAGDLLGRVGTTGRRSAEQSHLHLGVRRAGTRSYVDPMTLLGPAQLPSAPEAGATPAQSNAQSAPSAERPVHVNALEHGARRQTSVRAQSPGDVSPATRHGAGSVATRSPAGVPAREGHAAEQATGRVAPPPLAVDAPDEPDSARTSRVIEAVPKAAVPENGSGSSRILLLAIAAVCMVALLLRRGSGRSSHSPGAPATEASGDPPGEVIAFDRGRRSA